MISVLSISVYSALFLCINSLIAVLFVSYGFWLFSYRKIYDVTKSNFLFFAKSCTYSSFACVSNEIRI